MKFSGLCVVLVPALLLAVGCGSSDSGRDVDFTRQSMQSLPSVAFVSTGLMARSSLVSASVTPTNISEIDTVKNFFKMECQMEADAFCPSTIPTAELPNYKFTGGTLIGNIYHANMYLKNIVNVEGSYKSCSSPKGDETTVTDSSFQNKTNYIMDLNSLYNCLAIPTMGDNSKSLVAYSKSTDDAYYATVSFRKDANGQTDVFQNYISMEGATPKFLAFNFAGLSTMADRVILLANFAEHKFAVKLQTGVNRYLVAAGIGGLDYTTNAKRAGYYKVTYSDDSTSYTPTTICVNNENGAIVDASLCTGITWTSFDTLATYLGISATDKEKITGVKNFSAFLADMSQLSAGQYPTGTNASTTDKDNFPTP